MIEQHFYELWRGPRDPYWHSLSYEQREQWARFARAVFEEYSADLPDPDEGCCR